MTVLTLHIPDELSTQADKFGLLNEQSILLAFRQFLEQKKVQKARAWRSGMVGEIYGGRF
ncbi:hypothetical protein [Moraxella nonliquefaciens]|jgi:hypothetical protein|uniref:hypothetical protein n=1 Tax=Moraxella nonliquefaciens TaxID=478 RepID=UPI00081ED1E2|nr:hypothetical protein [Moraxella nonliquefaciens]OBX50379.1 hypothetical protein A9Z65_06820 [Moraxella nonliquefaciens]